jgi:predicted acylesterase/phospholipase RssA
MQRELSASKLEEADLVIAPRRNGTSFYDFHEAKKMIDMGERAAEAALGHLERLAADGRPASIAPAEPAHRAAGDLA